jgi:Bacterial extracellular solute-binding proteins, family 3
MMASVHAQQAPAPSRLDDIIKRGTLRVSMTGDYLPFTSLDKASSKFRGFDVDLAEALGKALGVRVEYVQTAWPQLMKDFEADNFDIAMGGVSITLDRQKKGFFSIPIMREGKTPIARCADKSKYETLAEIDKPGTRVIVNPGGTNERLARQREECKDPGLQRQRHDFRRDRQGRCRPDDDGCVRDAVSAEVARRRALRRASGSAVRLCGKGLLAAARCRAESLRRPVAAHRDAGWHLQADLCGVVRMMLRQDARGCRN